MLRTVPIHELHEQLNTDPQTVLIDVRTTTEYDSGHVAQAQNIPLGTMMPAQVAAEWGRQDEGKPIFIISQSAVRAQLFVEALEQVGFDGALCVAGGMVAWQAAGLPLKKGRPGRKSISTARLTCIVGGLAAIAGCTLGMVAHEGFFAIPISLGALQLLKGLTGWDAVEGLLRRLPGIR